MRKMGKLESKSSIGDTAENTEMSESPDSLLSLGPVKRTKNFINDEFWDL